MKRTRGAEWKLPYAAVEPPRTTISAAAQTPPPAAPPQIKPGRGDFRCGEKVSFEDKYLQNVVLIRLTAMNPSMTDTEHALAAADQTDGPRRRPISQLTDWLRTMAAICCPSRCSTTGRHGTRLNPMPSSSIAKRPLASWTERR